VITVPESILTLALAILGWLLLQLKRTYDEKLRAYDAKLEEAAKDLRRVEHDKHSVHHTMGLQTSLISERVTKVDALVATALSDIDRRLTRIEGVLDALMRARPSA